MFHGDCLGRLGGLDLIGATNHTDSTAQLTRLMRRAKTEASTRPNHRWRASISIPRAYN
jgi:hypothetical protein